MPLKAKVNAHFLSMGVPVMLRLHEDGWLMVGNPETAIRTLRVGHCRDLHRQQKMALHLRMVLRHFHVQEIIDQADKRQMPQMLPLCGNERDTGDRPLRLRHSECDITVDL